MDDETRHDINSLPLSAEVISCPNCGTGHGLQFLPMSWSTWAQCRCGYGWDIPSPNVSQAVN